MQITDQFTNNLPCEGFPQLKTSDSYAIHHIIVDHFRKFKFVCFCNLTWFHRIHYFALHKTCSSPWCCFLLKQAVKLMPMTNRQQQPQRDDVSNKVVNPVKRIKRHFL